MMKLQKFNEGFTLVELLVVLALISMLVSYTLTSVGQGRSRGRDAKRESDMKQIQEGLAIYATAFGNYPRSCTNNAECSNPSCAIGEIIINRTDDCLTTQLKSSGAMNSLAIDPFLGTTGNCGTDKNYLYCYTSDGNAYTLRYELETDTILGKTHGWNSLSP